MDNIAVYKEKTSKGTLSEVITVFSFSGETHSKIAEVIELFDDLILVKAGPGNKPGSMRFKIRTTKERFNSVLEEA